LSSQPRLSADGLFYWDGKQWVSALSPDGRHRWDGSSWVPIPMSYAPPQQVFVPVPPGAAPVKPAQVPTAWTRPLQIALATVYALQGLYAISAPFWLGGALDQSMRQVALRQARQNPGLYPNPNQYADTMSTFGTVILAVIVLTGLAIVVVVLVGTWRRWTWMYYVVLVLLAFQIIGLPDQVAGAAGLFRDQPTVQLPAAAFAVGTASGLLATGLFAWMLVALLRRGPWATRRLTPQ
jgi:hypothetical protein